MNNWKIFGASVAGKKKILAEQPCQDAHTYRKIDNEWNLIVVSDGAGSYSYSHYGARFFVKYAANIFMKEKNAFLDNELHLSWELKIANVFSKTLDKVMEKAKKMNISYDEIGGTALLAFFSDTCLFTAHIGDGRIGYRTTNDEWFAAIKPHEGEYAGETVFFNFPDIGDLNKYLETNILKADKIDGVVVMTDGAEGFSWNCMQMLPNSCSYKDINLPHKPFLNGNIEALKNKMNSLNDRRAISSAWAQYLENGIEKISNEPDDKTIVIAFNDI